MGLGRKEIPQSEYFPSTGYGWKFKSSTNPTPEKTERPLGRVVMVVFLFSVVVLVVVVDVLLVVGGGVCY